MPDSTSIFCYRGATVQSIYHKVRSLNFSNVHYKCIILHVGTNNFGSKNEWFKYRSMKKGELSQEQYVQFLSLNNPSSMLMDGVEFGECYAKLLDYVRSCFPSAWIMCSSVIPRIWDHFRRDELRTEMNQLILQTCQGHSYRVIYLETYRFFFESLSAGVLKEHYFCEDGLHLSKHGTRALRTFFLDKICKVVKGIIKDR